MKIRYPLSPEVRKEILADRELYIVFMTLFEFGYDSEIDPLHNRDYVAGRKLLEIELLEKSKLRLKEINELHQVIYYVCKVNEDVPNL